MNKNPNSSIPEDDIPNRILTSPIPGTNMNSVSWEEELERELLLNMPRTHSVSQNKGLPAYARLKMFRREIYGLALVDTGNLVKATLVSKEFWDEISGDIEEQCNFRVGTADKDGEGLKVIRREKEFKFSLDGISETF